MKKNRRKSCISQKTHVPCAYETASRLPATGREGFTPTKPGEKGCSFDPVFFNQNFDNRMKKATETTLTIAAPKFRTLAIEIQGTAPYMQCRFSQKAIQGMMAKMEAGSTAGTKRAKQARDFEADYLAAMHISEEGWAGIPASAFRNACIDACRMVGYKMTHAKMSIFCEADGLDELEGTPLVRINGTPERNDSVVRIQQTTDIRPRPMWRKWSAVIRIRFDEDQFTSEDVVNLIERAGQQVGVGEGRPYSKSSNGLGYGMFTVKTVADV